MGKEAKPLKAFSMEEIGTAIANAISGLTNTDVRVDIDLVKMDSSVIAAMDGTDKFEICMRLQVGVAYTYGLEENQDGAFKI